MLSLNLLIGVNWDFQWTCLVGNSKYALPAQAIWADNLPFEIALTLVDIEAMGMDELTHGKWVEWQKRSFENRT